MRVYLDLCALKRAYDASVSDRVRLEALAVAGILDSASAGGVEVLSSAVLEGENSRNPDPARRSGVEALLGSLRETVALDDDVVTRAKEIERLGLRPLDALHTASAEAGRCDYLVTCDDRMLKRLRGHTAALRVRVLDPLEMVRRLEGLGP